MYIRTHGPDGQRLEFFAESGGRRYEMGGVVPAAVKVTLHANVTGTQGQRLTWIRNGQTVGELDIRDSSDVLFESDAKAGDYSRHQGCRGRPHRIRKRDLRPITVRVR